MNHETIRTFYSSWPRLDERLGAAVAGLSQDHLAAQPAPDKWPLWATVGHLACQRVFWLCDFAGEPGADTTPFTNAAFVCPGDEDLENVLSADELVAALRSTFRIVERCLDTWTIASLAETIRRPEFGPDWVMTRGEVIQRVHDHDVWHAAHASLTLSANGLERLDVW